MAYTNFLTSFCEPCEVRISTMENDHTPVHYYVTLVNVARIATEPLANGFIRNTFRLKFYTQTGNLMTMILEEETNGGALFVPIHRMYFEADETRKPHFLFI